MADVFIRQTKPVIVDENWPPRSETPVDSEATTFFPPAPQPILRSGAPIILGHPVHVDPVDPASIVYPDAPILLGLASLPLREDIRSPVNVGSTDRRFTSNFEPVSNERHAGHIYGEGPTQPHVNLPKPPNPVGNTEVKMTASGAPISNNSDVSIMRSPASELTPSDAIPFDTQLEKSEFIQGITNAAINNEKPQFTYSPQPFLPQGDTVIQSGKNASSNQQSPGQQQSPAPQQGGSGVLNSITVGNKDVHFVPGIPTQINVGESPTIGGGGDITKEPGQDDRNFAGRHTMSVGSGETYLTASGDNTRTAGDNDKILTPNVGAVGNQETLMGSTGGAGIGIGDREVGMGGKGKPKNVRG